MAVLEWNALILCVVTSFDNPVGASDIGVSYGMLARESPPCGNRSCIGIGVTLGIGNEDLADLAGGQDAVNTWTSKR
ncbi:hypothetical protein M0R45_003665 [Rubus argutus]|uniref:Uncharacterized protein n=1 Tax=Rubus argutus TaxID=59490 RepID=A0AAW1YID5_RUBAR